MDKVIGGVLALAAFGAVVALGLVRGADVWTTVARAAAAGAVGYLAGWLLFGKLGVALAKEAAAETEAAPPDKPPGK